MPFKRCGGQVDAKPGDVLADIADQIILAWLSDDEAVCAHGAQQPAVLLGLPAQRQDGNVALDDGAVGQGKDPERFDVGVFSRVVLLRRVEDR
jgi:hypothetical protein